MSSSCTRTGTPPHGAPSPEGNAPPTAQKRRTLVKGALAALFILVLCKTALTLVRIIPGCPAIFAQAPKAMAVGEVHAQEPSKMTAKASVQAKAEPPENPSRDPAETAAVSPETWAAVREQKRLLESKEMELKEREARLQEMEQEIENRLKELIALQDKIKQAQQEIQAFREEREQARNAQVQALAKIYGNMKPKEASQLLESLEEPLAVKVISLMSPDQVAKILASMETKKAAKISRALSSR